jgi:hypothetical protein
MVRCHDKMDMIGHQTVAIYSQFKTLRCLGQKVKKYPPVIIYEEDIPAGISPLCYMMSTTCNNNSRASWHNAKLADHRV